MKLLKEIYDLMIEQQCEECGCEIVYIDEDGVEVDLGEAATMAFRRKGKTIKRQFRCTMGEKKGRLVANAKTCVQRKNPKRMISGRKIAASHKGVRLRKSAITRKSAAHKMVRKTNKRLKSHSTRRTG